MLALIDYGRKAVNGMSWDYIFSKYAKERGADFL